MDYLVANGTERIVKDLRDRSAFIQVGAVIRNFNIKGSKRTVF